VSDIPEKVLEEDIKVDKTLLVEKASRFVEEFKDFRL
jgi:hypothetical protein